MRIESMREIEAGIITEAVCRGFLRANYEISEDIRDAVSKGVQVEKNPTAANILSQIEQNYAIAAEERVAICQDCGMAVVFAEIGQEVHINGDFNEAIQEGVRRAYDAGYLRKSVVKDPLFDRSNTGDNTPAIIYTSLVPGDRIRLKTVSKGFGSENCSQIRMFPPAASLDEIKEFIRDVVVKAGPNACPPVIVGVGIGGTMELAALLAKKATARELTLRNEDPKYAALEVELLEMINKTGIGPGGFGGATTALGVNIEWHPTHIASKPVAVNMCCHASRHAVEEI